MGNIDWIPIADMPDALKDGRTLLLWDGDYALGTWEGGEDAKAGWFTLVHFEPVTPAFFAEINAPEASMPGFEG